jgi:hypothetical protein
MVIPGKIVELNGRVFIIDRCHYDEDGDLIAMTARCITPQEGDTSKWFTLEVCDESLLVAYTLH